nr:MAG TPA: minor structural protein [Caudoviricetes sp.]
MGRKDYHMALKRADIRTILENPETSNDDKAKAILDALHKETDELKDQLDAEKTARTQAEKDRDAANGGKQAAEKALTDYKAQQTQKDTRATKAAAYKQLLKDKGVLEKHFDRVVKMTGADIDALELDEDGKVKDAKKFMDSQKDVWSDFVGTTTTTGARVDNPPTNAGSKMTKEQIINIKDASERQAAIAANPEAFGLAAKE